MTVSAAPTMNFDIGRVISRLFGVLGRNFLVFLLLTLLLVGLPTALASFRAGQPDGRHVQPAGLDRSQRGVRHPVLAAADRPGRRRSSGWSASIGNAVLQGAVIHGTVSDLSGRRVTFGEALNTGLRFFLPLVGVGLIAAVCCFFGYLVFIVPGVLLGLAWCMAAPAEVIERTGILASLSRSAELTRNNRAVIFGLAIIIFFASASSCR